MTWINQRAPVAPMQWTSNMLLGTELWQLIMGCFLIFTHTFLQAQTSKECVLMKERISGTGNVNAVCSSLFQECMSASVKKSDTKEAQNQCLKNVGDCQMAGQLSGDDLRRVVDQYERVCKGQ
jgi:hypothetical protein